MDNSWDPTEGLLGKIRERWFSSQFPSPAPVFRFPSCFSWGGSHFPSCRIGGRGQTSGCNGKIGGSFALWKSLQTPCQNILKYLRWQCSMFLKWFSIVYLFTFKNINWLYLLFTWRASADQVYINYHLCLSTIWSLTWSFCKVLKVMLPKLIILLGKCIG